MEESDIRKLSDQYRNYLCTPGNPPALLMEFEAQFHEMTKGSSSSEVESLRSEVVNKAKSEADPMTRGWNFEDPDDYNDFATWYYYD